MLKKLKISIFFFEVLKTNTKNGKVRKTKKGKIVVVNT